MPEIYSKGNYTIIENGGIQPQPYPSHTVRYQERATSFIIRTEDLHRGTLIVEIDFTDIPTWTDDLGTPYTEETLRIYLQDNTGFNWAGWSALQTLQAVTDRGNTTDNDIIIDGKLTATEVETAGATVFVSQRVALKATGSFLNINDPIARENTLPVHVHYNETGSDKYPVTPTLGEEFNVVTQPVYSDVFTGNSISFEVTGTGSFVGNTFRYRFQDSGKEIRIRSIAVNPAISPDEFDLFGTSADPYVYLTSSAGITELNLESPVPSTLDNVYTTTIETVDGTPLNILGDNSGASFVPYIDVDLQSTEEVPLLTIPSNQIYVEREEDFIFESGRKLDNTFLYIVSGMVEITDFLDLNGSTIIGFNRAMDGLYMDQASNYIIDGGSSGTLKELRIECIGASSKAIQVDGDTGLETLVFDTCSFVNCVEVGSIKNIYAAQFDNCVFQSNQDGLIVSDTNNFAHRGSSWIANNTALNYVKLIGDFDAIKITGGGFDVPLGQFGLTITSVTSVNNFGHINAGVTFAGDGTHVDDVSFFEDSTWEVEAYGITRIYKDTLATGFMYVSSTANTIISGIGIPTKVAGTTTAGELFRFDMPADNRLRYLGDHDVYKTIDVNGSWDLVSGGNKDATLYVAKNGTVISASAMLSQIVGSNDKGMISTTANVLMSKDDYIEVFIANESDTTNIQATGLTVSVR